MKKTLTLISLFICTLFANAGTQKIYVSCIGLIPASVTVNCGDTINWIWNGCSDTLVSTTIPSCATAWNTPIGAAVTAYQLIVSCAGTYNYKCLTHTASFTVNTCTTGVPQFPDLQTEISLYPNPANINFIVESRSGEKQLLQVFDIAGKLMFVQNIQGEKTTIDASDLAQGVYNVCITSNDQRINKRLVIVR